MRAGAVNFAPLNARVSFARCFCVPVIRPRARRCSVLLVVLNPLMTVFPPFWGSAAAVRGWRPHRRPLNGRTRKRRFCHAACRFFEESAQRLGCSAFSSTSEAAACMHDRRAFVHLGQGIQARTPWRACSDAVDFAHLRQGIRTRMPWHACNDARGFVHPCPGMRARTQWHACNDAVDACIYARAFVHVREGTRARMPWYRCTDAVVPMHVREGYSCTDAVVPMH